MTQIIRVNKAEPIGTQQTAGVEIHIDGTDPLDMDTFMDDAQTLASALYNTLPGGTFDKLIGLLLAKKASQYVVSYGSFSNG